jgi:lipopolysaccharide export LptBFGC system permease protein LptF
MSARDIFGVVVRVFGLSMTIYSLWALATTLSLLGVEGFDAPTVGFFLTEIVSIAVGIYLLRGAPLLLRFSYPGERT